jgi:hypothetical protein
MDTTHRHADAYRAPWPGAWNRRARSARDTGRLSSSRTARTRIPRADPG